LQRENYAASAADAIKSPVDPRGTNGAEREIIETIGSGSSFCLHKIHGVNLAER